jgi:hypothetical protein
MQKKREISPSLNMSVEDYVSVMPPLIKGIISRIRAEKESGIRRKPSAFLIDKSAMLTPAKRAALLDKVASLVDENVAGRSDMCLQFAALLNLALRHVGFESYAVTGIATYFSAKGRRIHSWRHGWVRFRKEVVDGNTDSIPENIKIPKGVNVDPYWGPLQDIPARRLDQDQGGHVEDDADVMGIWWPDLKDWLDTDFRGIL